MSDSDLLQKIGLSKYQALLYAALLRKGPLDALTLSSESNVPMGKIYETISYLEETGIIIVHSGRPKKYESIIPEIAFQRIYMRLFLEQEKQRDELKDVITKLEQSLERKKDEPSGIPDLQIVYNNEDILNYLIRVHNEAKHHIIYVSHIRYGAFHSELDERTLYSLINNIGAAIKRGVTVKVIFPDSPYITYFSQISPTILGPIAGCDGKRRIEVRILNTEHNFILIDNTTCIFELEDQRDLIRPYVMIRVQDPFLNIQLQEKFKTLWEQAVPYRISLNEE